MSNTPESKGPAKAAEAEPAGFAKLKARAKAVTDQWQKNAKESARYQEEFDAKQIEMQEKADLNRGV